jgi:hypothetical protein
VMEKWHDITRERYIGQHWLAQPPTRALYL